MNRSRHLDYPECSMYQFMTDNAKEYIDCIALEYFGKKITYRRLIEEIDLCADSLSSLGIISGDVVSVCLPNIPQAVIAFYAINKIGAIANMIHPMSAENEIMHYLNVSKSKLVIAIDLISEKLDNILKKTAVENTVFVSVKDFMPPFMKLAYSLTNHHKTVSSNKVMNWQEFISLSRTNISRVHYNGKADECAVILYSGGTTGKPKGIMLSNLNFNALALQSIDACGCLEKGDSVLSVMPVFHGFGLGVCIHTVLNFGGTAIILPKFKADEFHKLIFKYMPNVVAGVPAIYESLIRSRSFDGKDLSFLKCLISGGDSLSSATKEKLNRLLKECGCISGVREGYGLTECVTGSCLIPENSDKTESVGLPYADTFYKIADTESGMELQKGEIGEIILRGPTVMLGYLNEPDETAKTLKKHDDGYIWLHTGDLGYMDDDGYVYFRQRLKRMIISGGYNIYPQIIENVIENHPSVLLCAVVGIPDEIMGQKVKAYVQLTDKNPDKEQIKNELIKLMEKDISRYAQPREIVFVESLPKTLVGKIAYNELMKCKEI